MDKNIYLVNEYANTQSIQSGFELLESSMVGARMPKAKIRTVLQTLDEVNKNRRIYPGAILRRGIESIQPLIKSRTLLGELDHPVPTGNDITDSYKHFVVLYEKVSHIFDDIAVEGNTVYGTVETSLTDSGYKMAGLIMDKVPVGFSLRAMGEVKHRADGVSEIIDPFNIVTYDCVSNPSHPSARMIEFVKESFNPKLTESTMLSLQENTNIVCDRTDLINLYFNESNNNSCSNNNTSSKTSVNDLEQIIEGIDKDLKKKSLIPADRKINKLISYYLETEEPDRSVEDFLDEYVNGKAPIEKLFQKYLKS